MLRLEAGNCHHLPGVGRRQGATAERLPHPAARVATANCLMATGSRWSIPRLDGIPTEYRLLGGIEVAARLDDALSTRVAHRRQWDQVERDPFRFVEYALREWVRTHGGPEIEKELFFHLGLVSDLDPCGQGEQQGGEDEMYLVLEPESAGYVVLGPTLRLLEAFHPRLPLTFVDLFTRSLNRWVRVYDYRDALDRVEQLREWYESDPEGETVELPDVAAAIPHCLRSKWNPLKERFIEQLLGTTHDRKVRALLEGVLELRAASLAGKRPDMGELAEAQLMDSNPPVPALVAVFEKHDAVEGCFDEESQGMLECPPEPNVILPFRVADADSVGEAFRLLGVICGTLGQGARLMTTMMDLVE